MTTLAQLKAKAEAARDRFERERAQLFRADGSQLYADAEHRERLQALRAERNNALQEIEREAAEEIASARADLTSLENGDPTTLLSPEELAQANARGGLS